MTDSELIDALGGPARVAELLGFDKKTGTQRVHNWKSRGIPAEVRLDRPDLFPRRERPAVAVVVGQGPAAAGAQG